VLKNPLLSIYKNLIFNIHLKKNIKKDNMQRKKNYLAIHRSFTFLLICLTLVISYIVFSLLKNITSIETILSTGAILATFGSAISAIGSIFERDLSKRIFLNIDILYKDIFEQDKAWRRWPFLKRKEKSILLNRTSLKTSLENPKIPINVGTHVIEIELPTVQEDFFDLGVLKNYYLLIRYRSAAKTYHFFGKNEKKKDNELGEEDTLMAYECLFDIWESIFIFRIVRYLLIFGVGFVFSGIINTIYFIFKYIG
jgi:hypothetical protein